MKPLVFAFAEDVQIGRALCDALGAELGRIEWHRFPDGETLVTLHGDCTGRHVIIVRGWQSPDDKALPFAFAAATARELGASTVGCVAPYLAYMRQDTRFQPGETRSASVFAGFLSASVDWLVTIDPHLHRLASLDAVFSIPATAVTAMPAVADWVAKHVSRPVLIGPDRESAQWAERVASRLSVPWTVLEKTRTGDRDVRVSLPDPAILEGRSPVIVDDIASSGRTLIETLQGLQRLGAAPATCVVVHALFAEGAEDAIRATGIANLVSTNTVHHPTNQIDIVPLIAEGVRMHLRTAQAAQRVPIPIAVSARHVHLCDRTVKRLFGADYRLRPRHELSQPGQFAAEETVSLVGPRGRLDRVRVIGPPRAADQIELSRSDEIVLGIDAPLRVSGDLAETPGIRLLGPKGEVLLGSGVITCARHIHMSPAEAARLGVRDRQRLSVAIDSEGRDVVFQDVMARISPDYRLELHLDTDEANAAGIRAGSTAHLVHVRLEAASG